tara:strand:- start:448 stop:642 length:195 start_codon:yes stop_codon:yes gene_type:complete
MTDKEIQQTIKLLTACGMVSRSEHYTHKSIRELVASSIHRMQSEQRTALLNTIRFLLYDKGGEQ